MKRIESITRKVLIIAMLCFALLILSVILQGCSSNNPVGPAPIPANGVSIAGMSFNPDTLSVASGTTVTWTNNDSVTHTVTSNTAVFNSGNLAPGVTFTFTFSIPGTYAYKCTIHPSMNGTIVVH